MPKETKKSLNSSHSTVKKKARPATGGPLPWSGAPAIEQSLPASPSALDTKVYVPLSAYYEGNVIQSKENHSDLKQKLVNRARAKFVTGLIAAPLAQLASPLEKQYKLSLTCAGNLTETPGKLTAKYCNCRWCLVCSRIRTAKMVAAYLPAIEAMPEKYFVTLSRPNVPGKELAKERRHYVATYQLCNRYLREKLKLKFSFIRKLECTRNYQRGTYHPHFHVIVDSETAAYALLGEWLERNPTALLNKGNLIIKADNRSVAELFKYFTKVVSKSETGKASDYRIHLAGLDTMFVALKGARTFQAGGLIKTVSEDVEPADAMESGRERVDFWNWTGTDWISRETAECLTGYIPSPAMQDIPNHIEGPLVKAAPAVEPLAPVLPAAPVYFHTATGEVVPPANVHLVSTDPRFSRVFDLVPNEKPAPLVGSGFAALPASGFEVNPELGPWPRRPPPPAPAGYGYAVRASGLCLVRAAVGPPTNTTTGAPAQGSNRSASFDGKTMKGTTFPVR